MYIDNKFTKEAHFTTEHHNFGLADKRGRDIGAFVYTFKVDVVPDGDPRAHSYGSTSLDLGHYFGLCVHASREGKEFGAVQGRRRFPTEAKRAAAIAKYLKGAKKRAVKAAL